jgi:hypothetical protein
MLNGATGPWKVVLSVLFFPLFFQVDMINYCWGLDETALAVVCLKRALLLLPALGFILACWISMASLLTVVVRHRRVEFLMDLLVTWWDLGRAVIAFWGGAFKFIFALAAGLLAMVKITVLGVWTLFHDVLLVPFRVVRSIGSNVLTPGVPWIAVVLTLVWGVLEAAIFTYVTTPLVMDTLSNMTGSDLTELMVRIPLFVFMLFIVLGSYAVLSTFTDALKAKSWGTIIKIGLIEAVVMFVEVMFLYREFVDALMPWFAQHAGGEFELGIAGILAIAGGAWFGIRGISWFLFASAGTPTLMAVIRGSGVKSTPVDEEARVQANLSITQGFLGQIRAEMDEFKKKGDDVLSAFVIPPLQILAASVNFLTLLLSSQHLFLLPFRSLDEVMNSKVVLHSVPRTKSPESNGRKKEDNR